MPTFKARVVGESGDTLQITIEGRKTLIPQTFDDLISKLKEQYPELDAEAGPSPEDEEKELADLEKENANLMDQKKFSRMRELQIKRDKAAE